MWRCDEIFVRLENSCFGDLMMFSFSFCFSSLDGFESSFWYPLSQNQQRAYLFLVIVNSIERSAWKRRKEERGTQGLVHIEPQMESIVLCVSSSISFHGLSADVWLTEKTRTRTIHVREHVHLYYGVISMYWNLIKNLIEIMIDDINDGIENSNFKSDIWNDSAVDQCEWISLHSCVCAYSHPRNISYSEYIKKVLIVIGLPKRGVHVMGNGLILSYYTA